MVLAVSSRVFVGLSLAHDKAWLDITSAYLSEVVAIGNALRPWPRSLRPLLRPFLAPKSRIDNIIAKALEVLTPAIEQRQKLKDEQNDLLRFLVQTSDVVNPKSIILKLLVLNAAAVISECLF
jgi:cytochrome P450